MLVFPKIPKVGLLFCIENGFLFRIFRCKFVWIVSIFNRIKFKVAGFKNFTVKVIIFIVGLNLQWHSSVAQLTVIQGEDMGLSPEQLVRDHLVGKGVSIFNVTVNGSGGTISKSNIGYFKATGGAFTQLNMKGGIIMTTGKADQAIGPNNKPNTGFRSNTGPDPDLEQLTGMDSYDACIVEFDFIPQCDTLRFRYGFGSEEFREFCGRINDAFGFFLSGPGINGQFTNNSINIAHMPGSSEFVTINNICADPSSAWDNENGVFFQYDAITYIYTAYHIITPYMTYHLKMVVGDALDQIYDSGVFLEMGSFSAGFDFNVRNIPLNPGAGIYAIEGCNDIAVEFSLPQVAKSELTVDFTLEGTAIPGIDYSIDPSSMIFTTGQDTGRVIIHPIKDDITEGNETVIVKILKKTCYDTLTIWDTIVIQDYIPLSVSAGNDRVICPGDTASLIAKVTGGVGPFSYTWNNSLSNDSIIMVSPSQGSQKYFVRVDDRCQRSVSDTIFVMVDTVAVLTNQPTEKVICSGEKTGIELTSNITNAGFSWDPLPVSGSVTGYASGTGKIMDQKLDLLSSSPGMIDYNIWVYGRGCDTSKSIIRVIVNPVPVVELGDPVTLIPGSAIELHAGGGFARYRWSTGSKDSVILIDQGGLYRVEVENIFGCMDSDSVLVRELGLNIPNAFTPNGDGLNDYFRITGLENKENVILKIFNRWGILVFETRNPEHGWDGSSINKYCQPDTYLWVITIGSPDNQTLKGTVTLVK